MTAGRTIIGGKVGGDDHPPLVVAEMSGNHRGSLDDALRIVHAAAEAGADAIKLQTFTAASLTVDRPEFVIDDPSSLWFGRRLWELYDEAHTPRAWHEPLFDAARSVGLVCISTAFDEEGVDFLVGLGVDALKISSFDCVHIPLIEAAGASGRPILLSTGMATTAEVDAAVDALRRGGCDRFTLLKCTSAYPSDERDANIATIADMRMRYGCPVGLSDHCMRPHAAFAATALGASVIEKHLTLRRAEGGVDAAFSLEPAELGELVDGCRLVWRTLGEVRYGPLETESASLWERPSVFAVEWLAPGQVLTHKNIRIIRPSGGLAPADYRRLIGRRAAREIDPGTPLTWDLVDGGSDDAERGGQ